MSGQRGRPRKDLVRDKSCQKGLPRELTRHSFIVPTSLLREFQSVCDAEGKPYKVGIAEALDGFVLRRRGVYLH